MNWIYNNIELEDIPEGYLGFVYCITNRINNRKYFGQKIFYNKRTRKPLKGKKQKRHDKVESDWRDYWGSSEELKADAAKLDKESFSREILILCESKALMNYEEARIQFVHDVLRYPDKYYNGMINCRISANQLAKIFNK